MQCVYMLLYLSFNVCRLSKFWRIVPQMIREFAKETSMYMNLLFMKVLICNFFQTSWIILLIVVLQCTCISLQSSEMESNAVLILRRLGTNVNVNIKSIVKFAI